MQAQADFVYAAAPQALGRRALAGKETPAAASFNAAAASQHHYRYRDKPRPRAA